MVHYNYLRYIYDYNNYTEIYNALAIRMAPVVDMAMGTSYGDNSWSAGPPVAAIFSPGPSF